MKVWKYKDKLYASQKVDWNVFKSKKEYPLFLEKTIQKQFPNAVLVNGSPLLYVPRADKCYYAIKLVTSPVDNIARFIISDVYTRRWCWEYPENVELVIPLEMTYQVEWKPTSSTIDKEKYRLQSSIYELLFNQEIKVKMKRFNIEEYKKNPNRKVVYGLTKQTPVRIVCTDCIGKQPVVALRQVKDAVGVIREIAYYFTAYGEYYTNCSEEERLYFAPQKVTKWFVYNTIAENAATKILSTKEEAEKCLAYYNRHGVTHYKVVSFDVEE